MAGPVREAFRSVLAREGLHAALAYLNARTSFRFTGVYQFDGVTLRSVALFDRCSPETLRGPDTPTSQTWCAITGSRGDVVEILDGRTDDRYPWMHGKPTVAYYGVPVFDDRHEVIGTLCHFDVEPRQVAESEKPVLRTAAAVLWIYCLAQP